MGPQTESLSVYRELADHYERLGQMSMRDRFLILAADAALQAGDADEAERFRQRLLQTSRYHMVKPFGSFAEAAQAPDVQTYLRDLRANYPLDTARQLLDSLQTGGGAAADQTQPVNWGAGSAPAVASKQPVPPTAPVVDIYGLAPEGQARPTWQPAGPVTVPAAGDEPSPEATPSPYRPLGQPLPGRLPATRQAPAVNAGRPAPPAPAPAPSAPAPPPPAQGGWLSLALLGLVVLAGVALAAFTLARPFLPAGWLP